MSIVMNQPCPACQENGRDKTGNHLMVFDDGNRLCNHWGYHKSGEVYFVPADEEDPILGLSINGKVKYTVDQFKTLLEEGKLDNDAMRELALSGMRGQDRWEVSTDKERAEMLASKARDLAYFKQLKVNNLKSRHIRGEIANMYRVKVGYDENGEVDRHFYPRFDLEGKWLSAKCRTLPKDFKFGSLGHGWGEGQMFGQYLMTKVLDSGATMGTLMLTGGECDAMAGQQMLIDASRNSQYKGRLYHVWSPNKGEASIEEIILHLPTIKKFRKVILAFDNDETGQKLTSECAKLIGSTAFKIEFPVGTKDVNDCLKKGKSKEFVDSWFNPASPFAGGDIRTMSSYREKALEKIEMGASWWCPDFDMWTYGHRTYFMTVLGMGTGVGKTLFSMHHAFHLAYNHDSRVMVIFLENQGYRVVREFAGFLIGKDLTAPAINDKDHPDYLEMYDYTEQEAEDAVNKLCDEDKIHIGDLEGRKEVDTVMEVIEQAIALGFTDFIIDNLTAFEHTGKDGKKVSENEAIKETMKRLGTLKDENPINILLLSHLNRNTEIPHEEGGEVRISHFMGSSSITFWANLVLGGERNTKAPTLAEKCVTTYRNLKSRDAGHTTGETAYVKKSMDTGRLLPLGKGRPAELPSSDKSDGKHDNFEYS